MNRPKRLSRRERHLVDKNLTKIARRKAQKQRRQRRQRSKRRQR